MRRDEEGVTNVVGAILVLASLVAFMAAYNLNWVPVKAGISEGERSALLRTAVTDWATTAENYAFAGQTSTTFVGSFPLGFAGEGTGGSFSSRGAVALTTAPTLTVSLSGNQVAQVTGAMEVETQFQRFPAQTYRYAFGALEVTQANDDPTRSWVDLRSLLTVERGTLGTLSLNVQALSIAGGPTSQGGLLDLDVRGSVSAASDSTQAAGTVKVLVDGIQGTAWKAAVDRTLGSAALVGVSQADCSTATTNYCFDSDTTDADTVDLHLLNVATGWTLRTGTVDVELRA